MFTKDQVLEYHSQPQPGKLEIALTKPCHTQEDLSRAYTPGVAIICEAIHENPERSYSYTSKANLVAVITNGSAVLGLGNLGPEAAKPVMEGKAVLFKRFADVDVFDIELNETNPQRIIEIVAALEPTFGGINLEDIKAPECFQIEEKLIDQLDIPVFHDDQHGTAIITAAALLNALELQQKNIGDVTITVSGAGAAAIACCNLFLEMGAHRHNITMVDSKGVVSLDRTDLNMQKRLFAIDTKKRTLADAMVGADIFLGVSSKDILTPAMLLTMAERPIVFALANPDPEIRYELARETRADLIMASGRSDKPNQVNNVLGFPFIFRGALDVRARKINNEMKIAASKALAELAKQRVPDEVCNAHGGAQLAFGNEYIIPSPFDRRVLTHVAPAVAKAAMETGVARLPIADFDAYIEQLQERIASAHIAPNCT